VCNGKYDDTELEKLNREKRFNQFDLNLRYCPENEVQTKKREILDMKFALSACLRHLKDIG